MTTEASVSPPEVSGRGDTSPARPDGNAAQDLPALTALRAVAALLVFLYHFPPKDLGYLVDVVASQGHVGVTVFFVLSGFLITVRYAPRFGQRGHGLADYFVRRAARILPLYFVVLTLTHLLSTGMVPVDSHHWPEWTLTQALFGRSVEDVAIPTSWSLTVEECFYASAPLLFLSVAALRRRLGTTAGAAFALGVALLSFHLTGTLILTLTRALGATDLPYLSDEALLRSFTVFGRFPDFAVGVGAGLLYLTGRVETAWRRRGTALASVLSGAGLALGLVAQMGMVRAADDATAAWRWNVVAAVASGVLVLALTCRHAPVSRLLSFRLPVYLGRVSYALYLIQLTPLGNGLLYRVLPGRDGVHLVVLYVGMSFVAMLLFELVEEPGRKVVLALWRRRSLDVLELTRTRGARARSLAVLLGIVALQYAVWAIATLPAIDEARVVEVLGPHSPHLVRSDVTVPADDGREPRVRLPASWRLGPRGDRRAPPSLLVFVDGNNVPFEGARPPVDAKAVAYYRRPRAEYLSLQLPSHARVTIVNHAPLVALSLIWSRLREAPVRLLAPFVLLLASGAAAYRSRRTRILAPHVSLALASGLLVVWLAGGFHLQPWGPLVLVLQVAALAGLVVRRGAYRDAALPTSG